MSLTDEMLKMGWRRRIGLSRASFYRPNSSIVNRRRDLSESEDESFGHVLFPGRKRKSCDAQPVNSSDPQAEVRSLDLLHVQPETESQSGLGTHSSFRPEGLSQTQRSNDEAGAATLADMEVVGEVEVVTQTEDYNHKDELKRLALDLECLRDSGLIFELDIDKSVSSFDDSLRNIENPLRQMIPLKSRNIFVDVLRFALKENRELLYTIIRHMTSANSTFNEKTVIQIANTYMNLASNSNRDNIAFKKLKGLLLQSCGLNENGIREGLK